jgi:hypothetical protein
LFLNVITVCRYHRHVHRRDDGETAAAQRRHHVGAGNAPCLCYAICLSSCFITPAGASVYAQAIRRWPSATLCPPVYLPSIDIVCAVQIFRDSISFPLLAADE